MNGSCRYCGKQLQGRADKKFCNDFCRNEFNNQKNRKEYEIIRKTNILLKRNRQILIDLLGSNDKLKIKKEALLEAGFKSKFHTEIYQTQKGHSYYFCYELGWLLLDEDWTLIVRKKSKTEL